MKKTSVVFSGFMAAILFGTGATHAATQIASKQYVDNKASDTLTTIENTYATKESVTQLETTVNDPTSGLKTSVEQLETTVGDSNSGLVKDVNDLKTSVDSKLDSSKAATTYEVLTNKSQNLNTDAASTEKYPSAKAVVDWVNEKVTDGIEINTDKIQNGAITEEKLSENLSQKIDGKEDKSNKVTTLNPDSLNATTEYPSVSAVATWTKQQIDAVEFNPENIAPGSIGGDKITDGTITSDNLDSALNAEISGKQDKNIPGAKNHVVITDGEGNITTAAQIAAGKVSGLSTVATTGAYSDLSGTPTIPTTVAELTDAANYATTTALTEGLATKQNVLGYTAENVANKTQNLNLDAASSDKYPSAKAVVSWVNEKVTDGIEINTDAIQNGAVSEEKLSEALQNKIDGKADKANVYTKTETDNKIIELAIKKPTTECMESPLCVLSVNSEGNYVWTSVTEPLE